MIHDLEASSDSIYKEIIYLKNREEKLQKDYDDLKTSYKILNQEDKKCIIENTSYKINDNYYEIIMDLLLFILKIKRK